MGGKKQTKKQTKQHLYFCFVLIFFFIFFLWVFCVWRESSEHFGVIRRSYYYLRIAYISPFLGVSYGKNLWPCSLVPCPPKHDRLHIKCALKTPLVRTTSAHIFTLTHFLIKKKYTEYKIYIKKKKRHRWKLAVSASNSRLVVFVLWMNLILIPFNALDARL